MTSPARLATYGTLGPGRANHHHLAGLTGHWSRGTVRGRLIQAGWGAELGYPGLVPCRNGPTIEVDLLVSLDLPDHWARLDAFEGAGYARVLIDVQTADGSVTAWIYALANPADLPDASRNVSGCSLQRGPGRGPADLD